VPPSLTETLGTHLREALPTDSPKLAEILKAPTVARFKADIYRAKHGSKDDALIREALRWRDVFASDAAGENEDDAASFALDARVDQLRRVESPARVDLFTQVATGTATPINTFVDQWLDDKPLAGRTMAAYRASIKRLEEWCAEANISPALETMTAKRAARFASEALKREDPATANKTLTGLSSYWTWLLAQHHLDPDEHRNVWQGNRRPKRKPPRGEEDDAKRPFTDSEVVVLIGGIKQGTLLGDLSRVAALTGARLNSIAELKAKQVEDGVFKVWDDKTPSGRRVVPVHADLKAIVKRRMKGKGPDDYLFPELPTQKSEARGRGAPASQAFTRQRRALGVDDQPGHRRQSRVDFHSWRRWFIRMAVEALEQGAKGFTPWTIADVVGHSKEDGPLPMTMGRYPGKASIGAMRACVEAVKLPTAASR
jgi:integrase